MKIRVNLGYQIFNDPPNLFRFESKTLHASPNRNGVVLPTSESAETELAHDVAGREGLCVVEGVGQFEEGEYGFLAVVGFLEAAVVVGDELALVVGGLGLEAVVEQVERLGVGSLVGQGEGVEVYGVLEVDDEIASCAFGAADEVVLVGDRLRLAPSPGIPSLYPDMISGLGITSNNTPHNSLGIAGSVLQNEPSRLCILFPKVPRNLHIIFSFLPQNITNSILFRIFAVVN